MKKFIAFLFLVLLFGGTYIGAWVWLQREADSRLPIFIASAPSHGVAYAGPAPQLKGFPFVPTVTFEQGMRAGNWQISFSTMTVSGYPIPGLPLTLSFPAGVIAWQEGQSEPLAFQSASLTIRTPWPLPEQLDEEGLAAWRDAGGEIVITDSEFDYEGATVKADGTITLDAMMQPAANLNTQASGYATLVQTLIAQEKIKPFAGIALVAALNNMASADEKSGEMIAALPVIVQNRGLYVGPILVQEFPEIVWDKRNPPAPHQ